jgi:hypothetical protein
MSRNIVLANSICIKSGFLYLMQLVQKMSKVTELKGEYQKRDIEKWGNNSKM